VCKIFLELYQVYNVQVENIALDTNRDEEKFVLPNDPSGQLVALAFKLEEGKYGQLTYVRVYSGTLTKGSTIINVASRKKHKVPRIVRTHADELEDVAVVTVGSEVFFWCDECG
jgi:elongation factor G